MSERTWIRIGSSLRGQCILIGICMVWVVGMGISER